jgi:hypothetical protein
MENRQEAFAAAIVDLVQQFAIALTDICRPHDVDIRVILHIASGIARGFVDVDDNRVTGMLRVECSMCGAHQADIGTCRPKSHAIGKGLNTVDLQAGKHVVSLS